MEWSQECSQACSQVLAAGERQWRFSTVLTAASLENLHALNRIYLDLLAREGEQAGEGLPARITACLSRLDPLQRLALATSPFSLFDARFGDEDFWARLTGAVHDSAASPAATPPALADFARLALFYAWHLVRADALAARLLLGMSHGTHAVFAALPLPWLQQLASDRSGLITPRWPDRDTVWRILLGAASRNPHCMAEPRMFGIQVIAGDLSGQAFPGARSGGDRRGAVCTGAL